MKTNFIPLTHGYKFPNRFEFKGLSKLTNLFKNNLIYGMCGGMVFSALDHYFDQKMVAGYKIVEDIPDNYTKYLWKRQRESVSFSVLMKIIYFTSLSINRSVKKSILVELPKIKWHLNDDLPVPLVIIRASLLQNPTHNHQILVTELLENGNRTELFIYDPNHPGKQPIIEIDRFSHKIIQSTGELVRGFFVNKYSYKTTEDIE